MKFFLPIVLSFGLFMGCAGNAAEEKSEELHEEHSSTEEMKPEKLLRHAVFFKFKAESTPEDIKAVEAAFADLPNKIPQIKGYEWGTNNSPEGLNKDFTHCFFLTFHSEEDRDAYLPHPDHKVFGGIVGPHLDDVFVLDYWTE